MSLVWVSVLFAKCSCLGDLEASISLHRLIPSGGVTRWKVGERGKGGGQQ